MHTALDILKLNSASDGANLIEANKSVAPELGIIPGFTITDSSYTTVRRTSWPEGGFTKMGAGSASGQQTFENVTVQCANYKNLLEETADRAKKHRRGVAAFLAMVASGGYQGALRIFGRTFYYGARTGGIGGGADACPGLLDLYDAANMSVDAGGTTASTGSSVWFIKRGRLEDGMVSFVFGNGQGLSILPDWVSAMIVPDSTAPTFKTLGWQNELTAFPGVQLADFQSVGRIKKLTEDSGKGLTDSLGYKMLEKFPAAFKPDFALMTRRSVRQLRDSRTNTNGGAPQIAWPTDIAGVPIVETDSISNTEALTL